MSRKFRDDDEAAVFCVAARGTSKKLGVSEALHAFLLAFMSALATGHTEFRTYRFGQLMVSLIKKQEPVF